VQQVLLTGLGLGRGLEGELGRPRGEPLITNHSPAKLYFRQSWTTLEPQNKYIINNAGIIPEGKKLVLTGDKGKVQ
jgi:hypothetical protein